VRYRILADIVLLLHLGFILFAALGAFTVVRWPRLVWLQLPAAAWGVLIELANWTCPLTPLENWLRLRAGEAIYRESFVAHYLLPIVYPERLTRGIQVLLGLSVVAINALVYALVWKRRRPVRPAGPAGKENER
jgi:hypothetical protein